MNGSMMAYLTIATVTLLGCLTILTIKVLDYRSREYRKRNGLDRDPLQEYLSQLLDVLRYDPTRADISWALAVHIKAQPQGRKHD